MVRPHAGPIALGLPHAQAGIFCHAARTTAPVDCQSAGRETICNGARARAAPDHLISQDGGRRTWRTLDALRSGRASGPWRSSRSGRPYASQSCTADECNEQEDQSKSGRESGMGPVHYVPPFLEEALPASRPARAPEESPGSPSKPSLYTMLPSSQPTVKCGGTAPRPQGSSAVERVLALPGRWSYISKG
jgi:hypothetical protein